MQQSDFMAKLDEFVTVHGISRDIGDRVDKAIDENTELHKAYYFSSPERENEVVSKEAADVAIVCFDIMKLCGVDNVLQFMADKLDEVANRPHYREMRERVAAQAQK